VLEDGASYAGEALVGSGTVGGEIVFTTSIGGYQEIASDPSYHGQIVTYTFPMNGNYGTAPGLDESTSFHPSAIVAREITDYRFNRAAEATWLDWLAGRGCLAVTGVDTRALTRHIREAGAMRAVVSTQTDDAKRLRELARQVPSMTGRDLAAEVTCAERYQLAAGDLPLHSAGEGFRLRADEGMPRVAVPHEPRAGGSGGGEPFHVVVYDFGVKRSLLRLLLAESCRLTVVPARTSAREVLKLGPDGVFLSNGPGDPAAVTYAVKAVARLLGKVPLFGICLGHQLLALSLGLATYKLPFGHRGANHPVKDLHSGMIEITTQNHGFAVRAPDGWAPGQGARAAAGDGVEITHIDLNDGTVEGLACPGRHAFSVQYHPEASPGPHDARHVFGRFVAEMERFARRPTRDGQTRAGS